MYKIKITDMSFPIVVVPSQTFKGDDIERGFLTILLVNNYNCYEPFARLCLGNKCINLTRGIHKTDDEDEVFPHFNISIYDYDTRTLSQTYHCYVNMKSLKIAKITTITTI